jgi:hypothetical protein
MARATMVSVRFSNPPVVNRLPSEMNRLGTSRVWPHLLHTPSRALAATRAPPRLWVEG